MSAVAPLLPVQLDGSTRFAFVVGDPIAQVRSPAGVTAELVARNANVMVLPAQVSPDKLDAFLAGVRHAANIQAIVVTVPHKIAIMPFCDELSERAIFVGATNVIHRTEDGRWIGDNFDGVALVDAVIGKGGSVAGQSVMQVGAGGAGSAIAFEILERGASRLALHDVDLVKRDALISRLALRFGDRVQAGSSDPAGFRVVVNASPCGMRETDPLPVQADRLDAGTFVADVITKPEITALVQSARDRGLLTSVGGDMFDAQVGMLASFVLEGRV